MLGEACSSRLAGASGGEANWPAKFLPQLAGLMSAGDQWQSWLLVLSTSRLAVVVFSRCKLACRRPAFFTFVAA
jgi:hypothetical protein